MSMDAEIRKPFKVDLNSEVKVDAAGTVEMKTTDEIDIEPSESIMSSIDPEPMADPDTSANSIAKAEEALKKFEDLQDEFSGKIQAATLEAMFPAQTDREEYLKRAAFRLYQGIYKAAKLFLKDWCAVNKYNQRWSNPYAEFFDHKHLHAASKFVPRVFDLHIVKEDKSETRLIAENMYTAMEATIEGAKKLGFDNSLYRQKVIARFDDLTIRELQSDMKWLHEQRMLSIFDEHLSQVERFRYIPISIRVKWRDEIERKRREKVFSSIV